MTHQEIQQHHMLEGSSSQNSLIAFLYDIEIYFVVVRGGNKKDNVYRLDALRKRFNTSTGVHSTTSQAPLVHQIEKICETIQKLSVELITKYVKEWTLEEKID